MCVCLLHLNCKLLLMAVHDSIVYRYSTLADRTVHFDKNYTQNHHPVPFLCPWPVPDWWTSNLLLSKFPSSSFGLTFVSYRLLNLRT
jgi:hypothetical protein